MTTAPPPAFILPMPRNLFRQPMAAGQRYGRLVAVKFIQRRGTQYFWSFRCDCGNDIVARASSARNGHTQSCGCLLVNIRNHSVGTKHGMTNSKEYRCWCKMLERCSNKNAVNFERYGGRGISVCEGWKRFENFYSDMGRCPSALHSLERVNNNAGYSKENCVWATAKEQSRNRRSNIIVEVGGQKMCLLDAAAVVGIKYQTIRSRITVWGWDADRALSTPVRKRMMYSP